MEKPIKINIVRSDGEEFFVDSSLWGIVALGGFDFPTVEIFSSNRADGLGEVITGQRLTGRRLDIQVKRRVLDGNKEARRELIKFFSNRFTYSVFCTYLGEEVAMRNTVISASSVPTVNTYGFISMNVQFASESPYFEVVDLTTVEPGEVVDLLEFPYMEFTAGGSLDFSEISSTDDVVIVNNGDTEKGMLMRVEATGSYLTRPYFSVNGNYLYLNSSFSTGDVFFVDFENCKIWSESGAPVNIRYDSNFTGMKLQVGENTFTSATSAALPPGQIAMKISMSFYETRGGL